MTSLHFLSICFFLFGLTWLPYSVGRLQVSKQHFNNVNSNLESKLGKHPNGIECRDYHKLHNSSTWCKFVSSTPNCAMDEGFVNYLDVAFCQFSPSYLPAVAVLYGVWLIFLFVGLGTSAEGYFCPSLEFIAHNLKLSENIAGLTIVAFGNGAPDIFSAIAAFTNSNPTTAGVAIGALMGAAMLVTTVVAGLVSITQPFDVPQRPFLRDMIFFLATAFWLFYLLYTGAITLVSSIGFLCLYLVYVVVMLVSRYIHQRQRARKQFLDEMNEDESNVNTVSSESNDEAPLITSDAGTLGAVQNINNNNVDIDWTDENLNINSQSQRKADVPEEKRIEKSDTVSTDKTTNKDEEDNVEVDFTGRSVFFILFSGLNPINNRDWQKSRWLFKLATILQVPWNIVCKLTIPIVLLDKPRRGWNRPLNCLNLLIAPMFCVFATKGGDVSIAGVFPLWGLLLIIGFLMAVLTWFLTNNLKYPTHQWIFSYVGFVVAIIWTYTIANEIVNLIQAFGIILNVSNVIMGLTFLAWGNSIADVVADVALAKQGLPRMSWSACFGGPLFNILIGVGLSCTISTIKRGTSVFVSFTRVEAVMCAGLLLSLSFTFVAVPLLKFRVSKPFGILLICAYLVFLVLALLAGLNVI